MSYKRFGTEFAQKSFESVKEDTLLKAKTSVKAWCPVCRKETQQVEEGIQDRSGDEAMSLYHTCINCGVKKHKYQIDYIL